MKNKWKITLVVGLFAIALVCIFGGKALVKYTEEQQLAELKAQQTKPVETPTAAPENVVYTLPPAVTYTMSPAATGSNPPAVDTVETDEDGNVIITPDFENQANGATEIIQPDVQVTANVGGGGGEIPMESDGVYRGEGQPSATSTPAATPEPTQTTPPAVTSTPKPEQTPAPSATPTPKPEQTPAPAATPSQTPQPDNGNGGPPNRKGAYDGEISPDGKYEWVDAGNLSGWYDRSSSSGGGNGNDYDPDAELSGEKVGSFG